MRKHLATAPAAVALAAITAAGTAGAALPAAAQTAPAAPYSATVAGVPGNGRVPLVNLAQSSTQAVQVANLPANVGLYALHCEMPADPRQAPVRCDESPAALQYVPATGEARASVAIPVKVNAEFSGIDPNPQSGAAGATSVDCRVASCALYVLGAGRDSANPAYVRVWPTRFSPLTKPRRDDAVRIVLGDTVVAPSASKRAPVIAAKPVPISVTTASGLVPTVTGTNCAVRDGRLTALSATGTCVLRITTTGGTVYKPIVVTQVVRIGRTATV